MPVAATGLPEPDGQRPHQRAPARQDGHTPEDTGTDTQSQKLTPPDPEA